MADDSGDSGTGGTSILDGIGQFFSSHWPGGGASAQPQIGYYQQMADGTHLIQQPTVNGKAQGLPVDTGVVAPKNVKPPTDKPLVVHDDAGGAYAYKMNPDGTIASRQTLVPPDPTKGALAQSTTDKNDAETQLTYQKLADANAMLPYNKDRAAATIANLRDRIQNNDDLEPAKKQALLAQADRSAKLAGTYDSVIKKNNATAYLNSAKADKLLDPITAQLSQSIKNLQTMRDGGQIDDPTYQQMRQDMINQAAQNAHTGLTAAQRATAENQQLTNAVSQGNNRSSNAANVFDNSLRTVGDIATKGAAPGQGGMLASGFMALLNAGKANQDNMGGAPIGMQMHPAASTTPVSMADKIAIAKDVMDNGKPFQQAVMDHAANTGMVTLPGSGDANAPAPDDSGTGPADNTLLSTLVGAAGGGGGQLPIRYSGGP